MSNEIIYLRSLLFWDVTQRRWVESSWNVMAHGDAQVGKWRRNWRMDWVASTLYTTPEHLVSSIITADGHTSAASSRLNWRPRRFKWTRPFRRQTKYGFCSCAITFQTQSSNCRFRTTYRSHARLAQGKVTYTRFRKIGSWDEDTSWD